MKVKTGDTVLIISGKDRGKTGKVLDVFPEKERIMIEGLNLMKKHQRPRRQGKKGELVVLPAPLRVANVKLVCPKCSKPTRVGYVVYNEKKVRRCKVCKGEF